MLNQKRDWQCCLARSMLVLTMVVVRSRHSRWRLWRVLLHGRGFHIDRATHPCFVMARNQACHLQSLGLVKLHDQLSSLPRWH